MFTSCRLRKRNRFRYSRHTRNFFETIVHALQKSRTLVVAASADVCYAECQHTFRIKPWIHALQRHETPQHKAGPDKQNQRQRDFPNDDTIAEPASRVQSRASGSRTQDFTEPRLRRPQGRNDAEDGDSQQSGNRRECNHASVDSLRSSTTSRFSGRSDKRTASTCGPCTGLSSSGRSRRHYSTARLCGRAPASTGCGAGRSGR